MTSANTHTDQELLEVLKAFMQPSASNDGSMLDTFTVTAVGLRYIFEVVEQEIHSREQAAELRGRREGAKAYNRIVTNHIGKPRHEEIEPYGIICMYSHAEVSEAIRKANSTLIATKPEKEG